MPAPVGQLVAFREIAANVARLGTEAQLLEYSPPGGDRRTRDAGAHWLRRRGLSTTSDRIIVTGGVHQGISTAILSATEPGDLIVAEKLTYRGLIDVARFLGRRLETIEMDDQGATPDALRALCKQKRPRLLFLTPAFQNPTTAFMGEERRCDLARIAADNDLLVIEDDIYANLSDEQPPAVRDIYPDGVFYLNGPTKSIAPGLRTAFLCAPEAWRVKATAVQQSQALGASAYLSAITAEFILSGQAEDFLTAQKAELAARYRIFEMELEGADFTGSPEAPHVWLRLPRPWRAHTFSAAAEDLGVATTPADEFAIGREPAPHAVRLAIGAPRKRHALEVALQKIAGLLDREPMAPSAV
jgi:DNA-binding transcriptional MocR family regulator